MIWVITVAAQYTKIMYCPVPTYVLSRRMSGESSATSEELGSREEEEEEEEEEEGNHQTIPEILIDPVEDREVGRKG